MPKSIDRFWTHSAEPAVSKTKRKPSGRTPPSSFSIFPHCGRPLWRIRRIQLPAVRSALRGLNLFGLGKFLFRVGQAAQFSQGSSERVMRLHVIWIEFYGGLKNRNCLLRLVQSQPGFP